MRCCKVYGLVLWAYLNLICLSSGVGATRLRLGFWGLPELRGEPLILRPEQSDVGNVKENHGKPFEAKAKCPTSVLGQASILEDLLTHHAAS